MGGKKFDALFIVMMLLAQSSRGGGDDLFARFSFREGVIREHPGFVELNYAFIYTGILDRLIYEDKLSFFERNY